MFKALLKKQFLELASSMIVGKKGRNGKKTISGKGGLIAFIAVFGLVALSLFAAFMGVCDLMGSSLLPASPTSYFAIIATMGLLIDIIIGLLTSMSSLFKAKDNELLLTLPIPTSLILIARMFVVFVSTTLYSLASIIPMLITYQNKVGDLTSKNIIFAIILTLCLGLLASTISVLLAWILEFIASKFKNKNTAITAFWVIFFVAYYYFYMQIQNYLKLIVANIEKVQHFIKTYLYPIEKFGSAMAGSVPSLLIFIGISILVFAIVCFVLSRTFLKLANANQITKRKNAKKEAIKAGNINRTLLKKELKRFTASPVYMINAGLGLVFTFILIIMMLMKKEALESAINAIPYEFNIYSLFIIAIVLLSMLSMMACCSVSMEGNTIWILRSLPIEAYPILKAKRNMQIVLTVIPNAVLLIEAGILFKANVILVILGLAILISVNFFSSEFGLFLNLKKPNLTWINEAVPVKQSLPVFLSLFGGAIISIALSFGFIMLDMIIKNIYVPYIAFLFVFILFSLIMGKWLKTKGSKIWNNL